MTKYIVRRLFISIPLWLAITVIVYSLINLAPGDPIDILVPPETRVNMPPGWRERQLKALGLDKPLPVRYASWLGELLEGNMGFSFIDGRPVRTRIQERIGPTLKLMGTAFLLALIIGIPAGILMALKQYSILDYVLTLLTFASISIPSFFFGLLLIYIFALKLNLLPTYGMVTIGSTPSTWDTLKHLIMPAGMLALLQAGVFARYTRASVLEATHSEFVRTARAKGLIERIVVLRHIFRNALIPIITVIGLRLPLLLGGSVIVEEVFQWPGMGMMTVRASLERDYPVLMGVVVVVATIVLIGNLITDIAYAAVDPRIRYE